MPKYRILAPTFINNALAQEGDVVDYDGKPGSTLELIESEKPAKPAKVEKAPKPEGGKGADDLV